MSQVAPKSWVFSVKRGECSDNAPQVVDVWISRVYFI